MFRSVVRHLKAKGFSHFHSKGLVKNWNYRSFSTAQVESTAPNQEKSENSKKKVDDDDFLSKHGGKVALAALSVAAGLIYTYYLSIQDRNSIEKAIESFDMIIEPYELLDLRNANQIKEKQFLSLLEKFLEESNLDLENTINTEGSAMAKSIRNIPAISYRKFVHLVQANSPLFHRNNDFMQPPPRNTILLSYLLDRMIITQVERHLLGGTRHSKYSFSAFKEHSEEEKELFEEEKRDRLKSNIFIADKNQDVFRLFQFNADPESVVGSSLTANHYLDIPIAFDFLFVLLTMLMQEKKYPDNIQQRLTALFTLAKSVENFQTSSSFPPAQRNLSEVKKESDVIHRDVMLRMIYLLQLTGQFPAEKQVIETGVKWPIRLHRRKSPYDMIQVYEEKQKKVFSEWSYEEFGKFMISNYNCLWGSCYHEHKHLIFPKPGESDN